MVMIETAAMFFFQNYWTIRNNLSDNLMANDTIFDKKSLT